MAPAAAAAAGLSTGVAVSASTARLRGSPPGRYRHTRKAGAESPGSQVDQGIS